MTADDVAEGRRLIAYDWLVTKSRNRLHHADLSDVQAQDMYDDRHLLEDATLSCGRTASYVSIPGVFIRIGAMRCVGCCRVLGYPEGKGSPKNDNDIRLILGLKVMA